MTISTNTLTRDEVIRDLVSVKVGGRLVDNLVEIKGIDKKSMFDMRLPNQRDIDRLISNGKAVIYIRKA